MSSFYSTMKRSLEIELISAEGLKVNRKPIKKKTFCVVRIDEKHQVSKLDEEGGSYPIWKDKVEMDMPTNGSVRFISIEVCYRTSGGAEKNVGFAKIPLTDFLGGLSPQGHLNFLSYRLRDEYGDKCGIVNVSILVKPDKSFSAPSHTVVAPVNYAACSSQAAAAAETTVANGQMWRPRTYTSMAASRTSGYGGRVVTGVPVWSDKNNQPSGGCNTSG